MKCVVVVSADYCASCMVVAHDCCSLTPGCPCCDQTIEAMADDDPPPYTAEDHADDEANAAVDRLRGR